MALLFECIGKCCRNMLDTADIVRDAWYKISVGPSLTVTFARMSKSCRFWTSTKLRVFSSAPITRKSLCFDFGRTDRLYVFYEFDSCPKILESVRALQLKELGTAAARERHCPAILQSSVPRSVLSSWCSTAPQRILLARVEPDRSLFSTGAQPHYLGARSGRGPDHVRDNVLYRGRESSHFEGSGSSGGPIHGGHDSYGGLWHAADGPLCQAAVRYCAVHGRERIFGLYGRASFGL